jgi:hypothetical protein
MLGSVSYRVRDWIDGVVHPPIAPRDQPARGQVLVAPVLAAVLRDLCATYPDLRARIADRGRRHPYLIRDARWRSGLSGDRLVYMDDQRDVAQLCRESGLDPIVCAVGFDADRIEGQSRAQQRAGQVARDPDRDRLAVSRVDQDWNRAQSPR